MTEHATMTCLPDDEVLTSGNLRHSPRGTSECPCLPNASSFFAECFRDAHTQYLSERARASERASERARENASEKERARPPARPPARVRERDREKREHERARGEGRE